MRLTECEPKWLIRDGRRVGFIFRSPTRPACWQSCFETPPPRGEQWALFAEALRSDDPDDAEMGHPDVQGCKQEARWQIAGGIDAATFETMTVTPSLDGSAGGNWHGFITNGEIVGGI